MPAGIIPALIGGGIAAGGTIAAAKIGSNAAGRAAETQADYGREALALQRDIYNQQRADAQPWLQTGGQAVSTLGALMGLGGGGMGGAGGAPATDPGARFGTLAAGMVPSPGQTAIPYRGKPIDPYGPEPSIGLVQEQPSGIAARPRGGLLAAGAQFQDPAAQTASGYVTLRAPGGQVGDVPADQVGHYLARGATRV